MQLWPQPEAVRRCREVVFQWTSGPATQVTPTVRLGASAAALTQTYTNASAGVRTSIQTYTRADMLGPRANSYGYFFPGAQPRAWEPGAWTHC